MSSFGRRTRGVPALRRLTTSKAQVIAAEERAARIAASTTFIQNIPNKKGYPLVVASDNSRESVKLAKWVIDTFGQGGKLTEY